MTPPRSFYLAMDARLATMAADIATMRAQLAQWSELQSNTRGEKARLPLPNPTSAEPGGSVGGLVDPDAHSPDASGNQAKPGAPASGVEASAPHSESGDRSSPPDARPPAKGATAPAGISLPYRGRLRDGILAILRKRLPEGKTPSSAAMGDELGVTGSAVDQVLKKLVAEGAVIRAGGSTKGRVLALPPEHAATPQPAHPPAPPARKPTADQAEIERYLATKGVTRLPTAFAEVSTGSSTPEERAAIARHREEQDARRREEHQARNDRAQGRAEPLTKARA